MTNEEILHRNELKVFVDGFPHSLRKECENVISVICTQTVDNVSFGVGEGDDSENEVYLLSDGTKIRFPYRIYFKDDEKVYCNLPHNEKMIYNCIFTRNCDGIIREKHLRALLDTDLREWCMPYLLRLSSEYVVEIVELLYCFFKNKDNSLIQSFCAANPKQLKRMYQRMTSYWNVHYRKQYPRFNGYVGRKLFCECYAPRVNFERL